MMWLNRRWLWIIAAVILTAIILTGATIIAKRGTFFAFEAPRGDSGATLSLPNSGGVNSQATNYVRVACDTGNDNNNGSTWPLAMRTIQAAVNTVNSPTEIWVSHNCTYAENITISGSTKAGLRLLGGFAGTESSADQRDLLSDLSTNSVVDVNNSGRPLKIQSVPASGNGVYIERVSFKNGNAVGFGGGVYLVNSGVTFNSSVIANNKSATINDGYGIYAAGGKLDLLNSVIQGNKGATQIGGGLRTTGTDLLAVNNQFIDNQALSGGAVYLEAGGTREIGYNTFRNNKADNGAAIVAKTAQHNKVHGNFFINNISTSAAGASTVRLINSGDIGPVGNIFVDNSGGPVITIEGTGGFPNLIQNNTFARNNIGSGPLLLISSSGGSNIARANNNIFSNNTWTDYAIVSPDSMMASYNDFYQNSNNNYYSWRAPNATDLTSNPKYLNTQLTDNFFAYSLATDSPMLDVGYGPPGSYFDNSDDMNYCDRNVKTAAPYPTATSWVDVGAFELQSLTYPTIKLDGWLGPNLDAKQGSVLLTVTAKDQSGAKILEPTQIPQSDSGQYIGLPKRDQKVASNTLINVLIKAPKFLAKKITLTTDACNHFIGNLELPAGDANDDNAVNIIDLNRVLIHFAGTNATGDLNGDGVVDVFDLNITLRNFGQTGDTL